MRNEQKFSPSSVKREVERRLARKSDKDVVRLMTYHICRKMGYNQSELWDRFYCLPSMINSLDSHLDRVYNDLLFCFDVHDSQINARI